MFVTLCKLKTIIKQYIIGKSRWEICVFIEPSAGDWEFVRLLPMDQRSVIEIDSNLFVYLKS